MVQNQQLPFFKPLYACQRPYSGAKRAFGIQLRFYQRLFFMDPGNGTYSILGARASTSLSGAPSDGEDYSYSGCFGSGESWGSSSPYTYDVYDGSASTGIYVSCLSPGTNY